MNSFGPHLLNVITYLPLAGAILCLLLPRSRPALVARVATAIAAVDLIASLPLWFGWAAAPTDAYGFRFVFDAPMKQLRSKYSLGLSESGDTAHE